MSIQTDIRHKFSTTPGAVPTPDDFKFEGVKSPGILAVNGGDGRIFTLLADLATVVCVADSTRLAASISASQIGAANGVAPLDAGQKVPVANLPAVALTGLKFQGAWNAATNTPALVSATGTEGHYYVVSTAGATALDGESEWNPKDWAVFTNGAWVKIDNSEEPITAISGGTF